MAPKYTEALYKKAVLFVAMGNLSGAVSLFDLVLAIDPKYKYPYNAKVLTLVAESKYLEALEAYNKSANIDPSWSPSRWLTRYMPDGPEEATGHDLKMLFDPR